MIAEVTFGHVPSDAELKELERCGPVTRLERKKIRFMSMHLHNHTAKKPYSISVFLYLAIQHCIDLHVDFLCSDLNQAMWRSYSGQDIPDFENSVYNIAIQQMVKAVNTNMPYWARLTVDHYDANLEGTP